jgi:hypothetical protein
MDKLDVGLREKFKKFHDAYEWAHARLTATGASEAVIAYEVWEEAQRSVHLSPAELRLYKQLVAMHSVNGGELFGTGEDPGGGR